MSTVSYKCPCCSSALSYNGASGKLECASCGNSYDLDDIKSLSEDGGVSDISFASSGEVYSADDKQNIHAYVCQSCGAELMTDGTTTATECAYCGNPVVLPKEIESGVKPEKVVPFKLAKEQATKLFNDYFVGKRLIPNIFLETKNRVSEIRKLFVPYWLFDLDAYADIVFDAEKVNTRREGDYEVTTTKHYMVRRAGELGFNSIPVDGSEKLDDRIGESLEPYDLSSAVPFQPAVLAGAMADRADVDAEVCKERAIERVEYSTEQAMRDTVNGYSSVTLRRKSIRSKDGKVTPALMPVWLITTDKTENGKKKTYTFAINGQSGELTCDVPYDKAKAAGWFFGVFAGACAVGYGILVLLNALGVF